VEYKEVYDTVLQTRRVPLHLHGFKQHKR